MESYENHWNPLKSYGVLWKSIEILSIWCEQNRHFPRKTNPLNPFTVARRHFFAGRCRYSQGWWFPTPGGIETAGDIIDLINDCWLMLIGCEMWAIPAIPKTWLMFIMFIGGYELTPGIPRNSCYPASISWKGILGRISSWAWDKSLYLSLSLPSGYLK